MPVLRYSGIAAARRSFCNLARAQVMKKISMSRSGTHKAKRGRTRT